MSKQEKMEDIVAEMQRRGYADLVSRINAAMPDGVSKTETTTGNAAKMREALEAIRDSARSGSISTLPSASLVLKTCEDALAAPARNCDRFTDPVEASEAFVKECETYANTGGACLDCPWYSSGVYGLCRTKWLFAEAKGGAK